MPKETGQDVDLEQLVEEEVDLDAGVPEEHQVEGAPQEEAVPEPEPEPEEYYYSPEAGYVVHFITGNSPEHMPMMVAHVYPPGERNPHELINGTVFQPTGIPSPQMRIPHHPEARLGPSWHFPWECGACSAPHEVK